jgi:C-terminal processing protease CtpA/Prc
MKCLLALLPLCLVATFGLAQSPINSPAQALKQQWAQAHSFYKSHSYAEAEAVLNKLSADSRITTLPNWPDALYDLACYQALEGKHVQSLLSLEQAVDLGTSITVDHIREDSDLSSLHDDPAFQATLSLLSQRTAFWYDDPAIASPYKPVLTEDEKIAGLSKFWSEARFNFPFFSRLPDLNWDREYMDYLPQVRAAQTTADYYRVLMRFAATLRDGHTNIYLPGKLSSLYGNVAFDTQRIEDKVLVTHIYDPELLTQGVRVGSEIVSIDDQPVREYAESIVAPYVNGFTAQDRNNRLYGNELLKGPVATPVRLTLVDASGETRTVSVLRTNRSFAEEPVQFKMLADNIAYLAINEFGNDLGAKTMRENFASITQAKGLILDLRQNQGGNNENGWDILRMLTDRPFQSTSWRTLDYKPAYRVWHRGPGWWSDFDNEVGPDPAYFYSKPVILLIGATTYSAAEDFVVAFDAMHRGTLVGETTGGSTGDNLVFGLPGGGSARICTKVAFYPNGRLFEGIGVPPQVKVSPTVSDIRQGRDAALERAIAILR